MKKLCAVLVLLVLLVAAVAVAEGDAALNLTQVHDYEVADSLCYVGDTLYMLGTYGVYAYQDGELSTVVDLSDTYLYRYNQERPEDETEASVWEKAISVIFTDGQTLYGLQPYSGQIFQLTEGKLESYTQPVSYTHLVQTGTVQILGFTSACPMQFLLVVNIPLPVVVTQIIRASMV